MRIRSPYFFSALATCSLSVTQTLAQPVTEPLAPPSEPAPPAGEPLAPPDAAAAAPAQQAPAEPEVPPVPPPPIEPELAPAEPLAAEATPPSDAVTEAAERAAAEPIAEAPPPVDSVTPLVVNGSFFTRYELREGYEEYPTLTHPRLHREGDTFVYRARFSLQTNPVAIGGGQSVLVKFAPQAAGTYSTQGTPPTIGDVPDLGVYEAFTRLQSEDFYFDVGRFMMDYGEAMIIGNLGWNETARAFQGGRLRLKGSSGYYTDIFATLISEGSAATGAVFEGDRYFYGIYTGLGPAIGDLDLDLYLLGQSFGSADVVVDDATDPPTTANQAGATFFTLGTRIKQVVSSFDYRLEAGLQFGSSPVAAADARDKFAYQADGEVGITPARGLRIGVGGTVASGDSDPTDDTDGAWDELFPTTHKFLGLSDVFGVRSNALGGNAEISYKADDALILKLQGHALGRMEENAAGETYSGTELDTHVIHPIGKGAAVRAMYALFIPNEDYWGGISDSVHFFELEYGYNF